MGKYKVPTEGGSGGKRGHSNMEHWTHTEELKDASRKHRRRNDKNEIKLELNLKTYLLKHPEENLTIVMVTDEVMEAGTYFYMGEGEMEESEIIELLKRDFPDHPVALHFMFDDT